MLFRILSISKIFIFLVVQAVELFGGIDILVSNAAVNPTYGSLLEVFLFFCVFFYLVCIAFTCL